MRADVAPVLFDDPLIQTAGEADLQTLSTEVNAYAGAAEARLPIRATLASNTAASIFRFLREDFMPLLI